MDYILQRMKLNKILRLFYKSKIINLNKKLILFLNKYYIYLYIKNIKLLKGI